MNAPKRPMSSNVVLAVLILGLVAFVVYFYFFINPSQVVEILSRTDLYFYAGAFVCYFLFGLFSAFVWRTLLVNLSLEISIRKALLLTWVGLFFDAILPQLGWSGEISKTYFLSKDSSLDSGKIGASVVGQKIFTITLSIIALSLGLGFVLVSYPLPFIVTFLFGLILFLSVLALIVIFYVVNRPSATKTLLNWGIRIALFFRKKWNPERFRAKGDWFLMQFHLGIKQLTENPRKLIKPIIFAVISFVFELSVIFLSFVALRYPVPVDKVLIVYTLAGTLQTVGVTIFGFTEIVMTSAYTFLGIPVDLSFSVTLLTRVVTLWFRLFVSFGALQWAGIKIMGQQRINWALVDFSK